MLLLATTLHAEARVFDGVRLEGTGALGGTVTAAGNLSDQPETLPGWTFAVGPDFHFDRWEIGGRFGVLDGSAPLGWEKSVWFGPELRLGRELDPPHGPLVALVGGAGLGAAIYTRTVYDCWGSAGSLWGVFYWDDRECGFVDRHDTALVGTLSGGVEVSHPTRSFGATFRARVRTDATLSGELGLVFGIGPPRKWKPDYR